MPSVDSTIPCNWRSEKEHSKNDYETPKIAIFYYLHIENTFEAAFLSHSIILAASDLYITSFQFSGASKENSTAHLTFAKSDIGISPRQFVSYRLTIDKMAEISPEFHEKGEQNAGKSMGHGRFCKHSEVSIPIFFISLF